MKDTFVKEILRDVQDNFNYSNTDYEIVGWEQKSVTKNNDVIVGARPRLAKRKLGYIE